MRTKGHLIDSGCPERQGVIIVLNGHRNRYIKQHSLAAYLSEILGPLAAVPTSTCRMYREDGTPVVIPDKYADTPLQKYIAGVWTERIYKVTYQEQVRYL